MCGIVGYIGPKVATPLLIDGLKRLEYRGYDSAGVAVMNGKGVETRRAAGKIARLEHALTADPVHGTLGIAHTRWATHGAPTELNAHPHTDEGRTIAVVHNGIIENATALRQTLEEAGHTFSSETDTEVLAHLIEELFVDTLENAVIQTLARVEGTYGIAVVSSKDPSKIVAARKGSPLLVGLGDGEYYVASDVSAILAHTRDVVYLDDGDLAVLTRDGYRIIDSAASTVEKTINKIDWDLGQIERGGFPHFMLKEIFEQPTTIENTMRGRLLSDEGTAKLGGLNLSDDELLQFDNIIITACGTSWHSALIGEHMLEECARIPVEVEYASEFRYRNPIITDKTLCIVISQSGETAETIDALHALPGQIQSILDRASEIEELAEEFKRATNFLYLGRGFNFPAALEGALKLKEISYIHAEGYPAAELKHGPIALIDENMPVVFIAPHDSVFDKVVSNVQEVSARKGRVIALTSQQEPSLAGKLMYEFRVPRTIDMLNPVLAAIPLQLLSYYIAVKRGCNVDQPRNLAKSVTD